MTAMTATPEDVERALVTLCIEEQIEALVTYPSMTWDDILRKVSRSGSTPLWDELVPPTLIAYMERCGIEGHLR